MQKKNHFYELFGISSSTHIEDAGLKVIYPNAKFSASRNRITSIDSDYGINSIILVKGSNRIRFKDKTNCRKIFNKIYRKYQGPDSVFSAYEAKSKYQVRGWRHNKERIFLRCNYVGKNKYVEKISFL